MKLIKKYIFFFLATATFAQIGPGGVGDVTADGDTDTNLTHWFKAGSGVKDASNVLITTDGDTNVNKWETSVNMATNSATKAAASTLDIEYNTNVINYNPALFFSNGSNAYFELNLDEIQDATALATGGQSYNIISVLVRQTDDNNNYFIGTNLNADQAPGTSNVGRQRLHVGYRNSTTATLAHWTNDLDLTVNASSDPEVNVSFLRGQLDTSVGKTIQEYRNGVLTTNSNTDHRNFFGNHLGLLGRAPNAGLKGYIAEVIIYNNTITNVELKKIYSYLAIKYGTTLDVTDGITDGDYVLSDGATTVWDASAMSGYHNSVFGVVKDDDSGLEQLKSKSEANNAGIVTIDATGISLADKEAVMVGSDLGALITTATGKHPDYDFRLDRTWKTSCTSTKTVDISFKISGSIPATGILSDYALLIDGSDIDFANATKYTTGTLVGSTLTFTGVELEDGDFFTLGLVQASPKAPGGISASMTHWLKADSGTSSTTHNTELTQWDSNNVVGAPKNATRSGGLTGDGPAYIETAHNFNPTVNFGNVANSFFDIDLSELANTSYNIISVVERDSDKASNYFMGTKESSGGLNNKRLHFGYRTNTQVTLAQYFNDVNVNVDAFEAPDQVSILRGYLNTSVGKSISELKNGILKENSNTQKDPLLEAADGKLGKNYDTSYYEGNISEIIVYNDNLSSSSVNAIYSYLAVKYGMTLATGTDYVASDGITFWDATANSDYHSRIGVIGRDNLSGLYQKQSKSETSNSILTVSSHATITTTNTANEGTLADRSFLAWGSKSSSDIFKVACGTTILKVNRDWKVQNTGTVGAVTLQFDMSGIPDPGNFNLIIDTDGDNDFDTTSGQITNTSGSLSGTNLTFTGVTLANNVLFTLVRKAGYEITYNGSSWTGGSGTGGVPTIADGSKRIEIQASVAVPENFECACLKVNSGQVLTVPTNTYINADELSLDGDIYLEGTSELIQTTAGINTNTGSGSIYKVLGDNTASSAYAYNYLSSPVNTSGSFTLANNLKFNNITGTDTNLNDNTNITFTTNREASANEISTRWLHTLKGVAFDRIDQTTTLSPGVGFTMKGNGTRTLNQYNFIGSPNNGNITVPILNTEYVLTGNPYPSSIDIDAFNASMSTSLPINSSITSGVVHLWYHYDDDDTHEVAGYAAGYATRAGGVSTPATWIGIDGYTPKDPGKYIRPGQGFIVAGQDVDGDLLFTNALRGNTGLGTHQFLKTASLPKPIIRLGFEYTKDAKTYHRQLATVPQGGSMEMETGYDAPMFQYLPNDAYWGVNNQDARFVISKVPYVHDDLELPIGVVLDEDKSVTFTLDDVENLSDDIYLLDKETNTITDLRANNYQTTAYSGDDKDRFSLVFKAQESLSNKSLASQLKSVVYVQNKQLNVAISGGLIDQVVVYDVSGKAQVSYQNTSSSSHTSVAVPTLSNQLYLVKVVTDKGAFTKKLLIE